MKNTIHSSAYRFIKYTCLNTLLLVLFLAGISKSSGGENETDSTLKLSQFKIYSSSNKEVILADSIGYVILLKNNRNCLDCFKAINEFLISVKDSIHAIPLVVALVDSTTLERKRNFAWNKELLPGFSGYYFEYKNSEKTLFDEVKTDYTPELILVKNQKTLHIPYRKIFATINLDVSNSTRRTIIDFLK